MNTSDKVNPNLNTSGSFDTHLHKLLKIGEEISKKFPSPQNSTVGLFIAHFIWIENTIKKSSISDISEMKSIRNEAEKVLGKWDKREWKRYLLRTAFRFKDGNSKPSQEIVNRFLMLIEYIKSLKINLKEIKNYFKEDSYKGVVKQAVEKLDNKKATKKTKTKSKTKAKTSNEATTKKQKKEPKKTTKKSANKSSKEVKRASKKSSKVNKTPKNSKKVKKTKKNSKGVARSPKESVVTSKVTKKTTIETRITSKKVVKKVK